MEINKIVKKLIRKEGEVVILDDLRDFTDPLAGRGVEGLRDTYKLAYALKGLGVLFPIKNGLYLVTDGTIPDEKKAVRMVEDSYWRIVKRLLTARCGSDTIVAGPKALEIRLRDFSIPDTLIVYTKNISADLRISDRHRLILKTAKTGGKTGGKNAFALFKKHSEVVMVDEVRFRTAGFEHALLDALTTHKGVGPIDEYAVRKALSKYAKTLDRPALGELVATKYLTAVNRLRSIAKDMGETEAYEKALDVVKREGGGCFVSY